MWLFFLNRLRDENVSLICAACCLMALVLASYAFRDTCMYVCVLFLDDNVLIFVNTFFCNMVLKNQTLKGRQYQHVLALCAIVHTGNIEGTAMYVCTAQSI